MRIKLPHFRPLRERRVRRLVDIGFTKAEAIAFTKPRVTVEGKRVGSPFRLSSRAKTGSPAASARMIQDRRELIAKARAQHRSKSEAINRFYTDHGFRDKQGRIDPWALFRFLLDESPTGRKKRPGSIDKGKVKEQKARYREKYGAPVKVPSGLTPREQLARLEEAAGATEDATRRQQIWGQHNKLRMRIQRGEV